MVQLESFLEAVDELVDKGVLGSEHCLLPDYCYWPVLNVDELPEWLESNYNQHGEIRWY